jgi:hypothetical protein
MVLMYPGQLDGRASFCDTGAAADDPTRNQSGIALEKVKIISKSASSP